MDLENIYKEGKYSAVAWENSLYTNQTLSTVWDIFGT